MLGVAVGMAWRTLTHRTHFPAAASCRALRASKNRTTVGRNPQDRVLSTKPENPVTLEVVKEAIGICLQGDSWQPKGGLKEVQEQSQDFVKISFGDALRLEKRLGKAC